MLKIIKAIGKITKRQISYVFYSAKHQNISSLKSNFIIITIFLGCAIWKPGTTAPRPIVPHQCPVNSISSSQKACTFQLTQSAANKPRASLYNFCSICVSSLNLGSSICLYDCSIKWEEQIKTCSKLLHENVANQRKTL